MSIGKIHKKTIEKLLIVGIDKNSGREDCARPAQTKIKSPRTPVPELFIQSVSTHPASSLGQ
jgi:hypothetical protein